jgi:hypothetical protein
MLARVYANATTKETQWVAEVEAVTPSGASYPLSEGALLGSMRKEIHHRNWRKGGLLVMPYHRYTKSSQRAVKPGRTTRYDVEIFPTLATIPKGDSLRVTISTSDTPHLVPIPGQLTKLAGGVYNVMWNRQHPSSLTVELRKPATAGR